MRQLVQRQVGTSHGQKKKQEPQKSKNQQDQVGSLKGSDDLHQQNLIGNQRKHEKTIVETAHAKGGVTVDRIDSVAGLKSIQMGRKHLRPCTSYDIFLGVQQRHSGHFAGGGIFAEILNFPEVD